MTQAITVTGDRALDLALSQLPPKLRKKLARKVLRPVGKPVHSTIKAAAPVEEGDYQNTIVLRTLPAKMAKAIGGKDAVGVRVVTDAKRLQAIYDETGVIHNPHWNEYGTAYATPQPHFRPGMDSHQSTVASDFQQRIKPLIPELAKEVRKQ